MSQPIHATAVARAGPCGWRGILLRGPSGSGKSDMALRLMAQGWRLVADDYTSVWSSAGSLYAAAPNRLCGRIEARGLGIVVVPVLTVARISLVVDCVQQACERMPDTQWDVVAGLRVPQLHLDVRPVSATRTVALAMDGFNRRTVWPI